MFRQHEAELGVPRLLNSTTQLVRKYKEDGKAVSVRKAEGKDFERESSERDMRGFAPPSKEEEDNQMTLILKRAHRLINSTKNAGKLM